MRGWIYLLHFEEPLAHAAHYLGCTTDLLNRLRNHANGDGSRLTRELHDRGIEWTLAALFRTTTKEMRTLERNAKNRNNGPSFCPLCDGKAQPGGVPYDISLLPFVATSQSLRTTRKPARMRLAEQSDQDAIHGVMKQHNEVLGFIPIRGTGGFTLAIDRRHVAVAEIGGEIIGYVIWTATKTSATIQQVAIASGWQQQGIGTKLIEFFEQQEVNKLYQCNVREDLPANEFWHHMQYNQTGYVTHKTSGNKLNHYEKGENNVQLS